MGQTLEGSIVTPCPMSVQNVRVADATDGDWKVDSGQDMLIADGGIAFSKGRVTCTASINTIIPRAGMVNDLFKLVLGQTQVTIQLFVGGAFQTFGGVVKSGSAKWSFADGKATGSFEFQGANIQTT